MFFTPKRVAIEVCGTLEDASPGRAAPPSHHGGGNGDDLPGDGCHGGDPSARSAGRATRRTRNAKARFYADENFPRLATEIVRANGFNILTAQQANRRGHPDENHAAFALKQGRVLLTCDRDYLNERRFPLMQCPVIVVCDFGPGSAKDIALTFRCLHAIIRFPLILAEWTKIDAKRNSWIEHSRFLNGTTARSRYRFRAGEVQEWVD